MVNFRNRVKVVHALDFRTWENRYMTKKTYNCEGTVWNTRLAKIDELLSLLTGLGAVILTCLTLWEIFARVLHLRGGGGATDISILMMWTFTYLCSGYILREGSHVRIDIVEQLLRGKALHIMVLLRHILTIIYLSFLVGAGYLAFLDIKAVGKVSGLLGLSQWPFAVVIPIGLTFLWFDAVAHLICRLAATKGSTV